MSALVSRLCAGALRATQVLAAMAVAATVGSVVLTSEGPVGQTERELPMQGVGLLTLGPLPLPVFDALPGTCAEGLQAESPACFPIRGAVTGPNGEADFWLFPGGAGRLTLTVTNPTSLPMYVDDLNVVAKDAGGGCTAAELLVADPPAGITVRARESGSVTTSLRLAPDAPDACKNVAFPLRFKGTAHVGARP